MRPDWESSRKGYLKIEAIYCCVFSHLQVLPGCHFLLLTDLTDLTWLRRVCLRPVIPPQHKNRVIRQLPPSLARCRIFLPALCLTPRHWRESCSAMQSHEVWRLELTHNKAGGGEKSGWLTLLGSQNTDLRPGEERQQDYNWIIHTLSGPSRIQKFTTTQW